MIKMPFVRSEELRADLLAKVSEVAATGKSLVVGIAQDRPRYELLPPTNLTPPDLEACVPVTADRARKNWSDIRATARLLDVSFLISAGASEAVFRRYPTYSPQWPNKWRAEHRSRIARVPSELTRERPENSEIADLRLEVSDLRKRVEQIERRAPAVVKRPKIRTKVKPGPASEA
jgi:hypothetical protein